MVQIKHFTAPPKKMLNFQLLRRAKWPWGEKILPRPRQRGQEIIVNQRKTYFRYSLNKAFHSPEFQAKSFIQRN